MTSLGAACTFGANTRGGPQHRCGLEQALNFCDVRLSNIALDLDQMASLGTSASPLAFRGGAMVLPRGLARQGAAHPRR